MSVHRHARIEDRGSGRAVSRTRMKAAGAGPSMVTR